jgi:hypothetical protein
MLLDTDQRVTDICLDVGYNSLGTFVRRFSEALGTSPMGLRSMRQAPAKLFLSHVEAGTEADREPSGSVVEGRIQAPASFSGPIFVGLFSTPIPEGVPVACSLQYLSGPFQIGGVPQGHYFLFVLGLPWPDNISDYFNHDSMLRGGGELVRVGGDTIHCPDVILRAAETTDPPILINIPALLTKTKAYAARAQSEPPHAA